MSLIYKGQTIADTGGGTEFTTDESLTLTEDGVLGVTTPVKPILTQSEYDALPPEEKSRGLYFIDEPDGETVSRCEEIYSTEETRIGTWIDGKPLYRRVYSVAIPSQLSTWMQVAPEIENLDNVVNLHYVISRTNGISQSDITSDIDFGILYSKGTYASVPFSGIGVRNTSNLFIDQPIVIQIEYTKTTDTEVTT